MELSSSPAKRIWRDDIVRMARSWIGTPYCHQASLKQVGCDCLGLVRGVWRELYGDEPETAPPYAPDWAERCGEETLFMAARRHMRQIPLERVLSGDLILFRMTPQTPAKHIAFLSQPDPLLHAYWAHSVCESVYGRWWRTRASFAFSFPGVLTPRVLTPGSDPHLFD